MLMTEIETDDVEGEIAKVAVRGGGERGGVVHAELQPAADDR